jgi:NADH:ubiquinone oxidoreductase subunit E
MGESCLANRSGLVLRAIQDHPCVSVRDNEHEKRFALEQMSCAGNCALSPTVIVDDAVHGRVVPSQVAVLLERYK